MSQLMRLCLLDGQTERVVENVRALVAEDASGQFGLHPGHEPMVTCLVAGVFRYQVGDASTWQNGATSGGLLHGLRVADGGHDIRIVSRRILLGDDLQALKAELADCIRAASAAQAEAVQEVGGLDLAMQRRLQALMEASS